MKHISTCAAALLMAAPALALDCAEGQRAFAHDGGETCVPIAPQRIVALHDINLTVPLLELGAPVIASQARPGPDGTPQIRAAELLTGQDIAEGGLLDLGLNPVDVELLATVQPDLIITSNWQQADVAHLSAIAPTVLFDTRNGLRDDYELYDILADLTGTEDTLAAQKTRYAAQIAQLKRIAPDGLTVNAFHAQRGELSVWNGYAGFGRVLQDAGLDFPDLVDGITPGTSEKLSGEFLPQLDADILFVTYRADQNETPADARAALEAVVPGYCEALTACTEGRMVFMPREEGWATSYTGLNMVAYAITTAIGTLIDERPNHRRSPL